MARTKHVEPRTPPARASAGKGVQLRAPAAATPDVADATLRYQGALISVMLVGAAVAFWRPSLDIFNLTKATVIVAGAVVLAALAAVRVVWTRRLVIPVSPLLWLIGAFGVGLVLATVTSDTPMTSFVGRWGRYGGLVSYATYAFVALTVLRLYTGRSPLPLVKALLVGLGVVSAYGALQALGIDPFVWNDYGLGGIFSTLGNSNFASGFLGITFPLAVWAALTGVPGLRWRVYSAALVLLTPFVLMKTQSFQGPVAAFAGAAFVLLAVLTLGRQTLPLGIGAWQRSARLLLGAGVLAGAALVGAGLIGGVGGNVSTGLTERRHLWDAAIGIFADHPVVGGGLDTFINHFPAHRPPEHANAFGFSTADNPHSVPLAMFAHGGLAVGIPYVAIVAFTAWALARGLRRESVQQRVVLCGLGGAWLAYQVQALVSFDLPPLALPHWVLLGAIVAVGAPPRMREVVVAGKPVTRTRGKRAMLLVPSSTRWVIAGIAVVTLVALWAAFRPLRADIAAGKASRPGNERQAIALYDKAHRLAPWESTYWLHRAALLERANKKQEALRADERAAELEPGNPLYAAYAARLHDQLGNKVAAERWFREALRRDPHHAALFAEVAAFYQKDGRPATAVSLLERSVELRGDAATWLTLAEVRAAAGDTQGARQAYEHVLRLDPGNASAQQALTNMKGTSSG